MNKITEITETDFRKLDLIGYKYEKMLISSKSYKMHFVEHHLNDELDTEKAYLEENPKWKKTVAFFVTEIPTEKDIKEHYNMLQGIKDEKERQEVAKGQALMSFSYWDKYFWKETGTFTSWVGVNHIYSKRTKWFIDADSECGELHKKPIAHIYIVYLGE